MHILKHYILHIFLFISTCSQLLSQSLMHPPITQTEFNELRINNPDSLLLLLPETTNGYLQNGDTLNAINTLIQTSKLNSSSGNYTKAYDGYWEALILSNKISDSSYIDNIYMGLGILYGLYGRGHDAESYFKKSVAIQKHLIANKKRKPTELISSLYVIASYHRELGNYDMAQSYLDSCWLINSNNNNSQDKPAFLLAEQGRIYYYNKKYDDALKMLIDAENLFDNENKAFLVIMYLYLGDIHFKLNHYAQSERYYLKAIGISDKYKSHKNMLTKVYQNLAELYLKIDRISLAYQYQQKSRELTEKLFDARGKNNSMILQIKDDYRHELEKQAQLLESNRINDLEQERKILFLKNSVLSISIASLFLLAILAFWYLQFRRKTEKRHFLNKQKLSAEKNLEILELKNKELTSSALQLIHKDELLLEVKNTLNELKETNKNKILDTAINKIRINSKQDWKEFDMRFTSINQDFYRDLSKRFPDLTQKDLKLCALIKLNFSSKEMSQLLGISAESVNTSRYRLRKKMGLNKTDSLSELINTI